MTTLFMKMYVIILWEDSLKLVSEKKTNGRCTWKMICRPNFARRVYN